MSTPDGKKIIENAKNKVNNKKENTEMKKPIIVTVVVTLVTVAALAGMFLLGAGYNQSINDRIHTEAKTLAAARPSK
jgi:hypothetical protein